MSKSTKTTGGYNVTVWRLLGGEVLSTSVAEVVDGRVLRHNGLWTANAGTERFHADFCRSAATFGGEPCELYVTPGTADFMQGFRTSAAKLWEVRKAAATRLEASPESSPVGAALAAAQ